MSRPCRIAIDLLGAENSEEELIHGALRVAKDRSDCELVFICDQSSLTDSTRSNQNILHCSEMASEPHSLKWILDDSHVTSMSLGFQMLKRSEVNGFVSVGSTGALMALGRHILDTPEGIDRPAVIKQFESIGKQFWMLDLGANIVNKSETLIQFSRLGIAYASEVGGVSNPSVALLNIGIEQSKGPALLRETAAYLETVDWCNFQGFIEPNHLFDGSVDIVVTDGYAGNIALKAVEGTARFIREVFLNEFAAEGDGASQMVRKKSRKRFSRLMKKLDSHRQNGASFVGLNGVVVKSHNSTTDKGMGAAVKQTINEINADMPRKILNFFST